MLIKMEILILVVLFIVVYSCVNKISEKGLNHLEAYIIIINNIFFGYIIEWYKNRLFI